METKTVELTEEELNLLIAMLIFGIGVWKYNQEKNVNRITMGNALLNKLNLINGTSVTE